MIIIAGLGSTLTERAIEHFGSEEKLRSELKENPYKLMDIDGISFKRADEVAKTNFGVKDNNDPRRQRALIRKVLRDNTSFGHTFLPKGQLTKAAKKEKITKLDEYLQVLEASGEVVIEDDLAQTRIYDKLLHTAEVEAVKYTKALSELPPKTKYVCKAVDVADDGEEDLDQQKFLNEVPKVGFCVLTGGPGTGKTFVIKNLYQAATKAGLRVALAAPTGKAAKRLSEATHARAQTIHRLLKAGWGQWKHNKHDKLNLDLLIVDESSMVDIVLAWRLVQSLPVRCQVVFVGDADQLPPVGPGAFFRDLINTNIIPVYRLRTNHRQGPGSVIAENAILINQGRLKLQSGADFSFYRADNPVEIRSKLPKVVDELLADYPNFYRDIQVLSPQKGTIVGTESLNKLLRFKVNEHAKAGEKLSLGDKVMQTFNDYELNLFNGYVGRIIAKKRGKYKIEFYDEGTVEYPMPLANRGGLMLSYASTVHKFQGSECEAGIVIVCSSHNWMLTRNLLYTAITRFKKRCIVLGDAAAFKRSIVNTKEKLRYSRFVERLKEVA